MKLDFTRETALDTVLQFVAVKDCTDANDCSDDTVPRFVAAELACEPTELMDAGTIAAAMELACDDTELIDATTIPAAIELACELDAEMSAEELSFRSPFAFVANQPSLSE